MSDATVRPLRAVDFADLLDVQRAAYRNDFHESEQSFRAKFERFPQGFLGAFRDQELCGYAVAFPVEGDGDVDLDTATPPVDTNGSGYYLHDIAVRPGASGAGLGRELLRHQVAVANRLGCSTLALVAVQGSATYWSRYGFRERGVAPTSYGAGAVKMRLALDTMRDSIVVRSLRPADVGPVARLGRGAASFAANESVTFYEDDELHAFIADPAWLVAVVVERGELVGFLSAHRMSWHWAVLDNFYVDAASRHRGAGRAAASWLVRQTRIWGTHYMTTLVDDQDTETARFLSGAGFVPRKLYRWFDIDLDAGSSGRA